jgi:ribosomal protein S18 acetylase RimI-like enzyme
MTVQDLDEVGVLAGRLMRMHYAYDPDRFLQPIDPERGYVRWLRTQLDRDDVLLLVACQDRVVGYVYARMEPKSYDELRGACAKLHDIYVDEDVRRQGVGEALLDAVFRLTAERGAPRVVLLTAAQNEAAQRLFKRAGFRTTMLEMTREL